MRRDIGNKVQIVGSPEKSEALNGHTREGGTAEKRAANRALGRPGAVYEDWPRSSMPGRGLTCADLYMSGVGGA